MKQSRLRVVSCCSIALVAYVFTRYAAEVGSTERFLSVAILLAGITVLNSSFDRLVVSIMLSIGFGPLLGWAPGLSDFVDPVALILASMLGYSCYSWEKMRRRHACEVAIVGGASLFTLWFWQMYWRVSPGREPMSLLLNGWDHVSHFNFFSMATLHDSFLSRIPHPEGVNEWFTEKYPMGIQMFWSQLARVPESLSSDTSHLLNTYGRINVINIAMILGLGLIGLFRVVRVVKVSLLIAYSLAVGGFVVVGPLSISLTMGFPNFGVTCGVLFVGMSVILRPMKSVWNNALVLNGVVLVCAYNWFPAALPIAIPSVVVLISDFLSVSNVKKMILFSISAVGLVGSALPILQNLGLGTSHLEVAGGIPVLSPIYPVAFGLLSILLSLQNIVRINVREVVHQLGLPVINVLLVFGVLVLTRMSSGGYPYYSQKFLYLGTVIAFFWTVLQVIELIDHKYENNINLAGSRRQSVVCLMSGLAALQIWGYVGPDYSVFAGGSSATGFSNRTNLSSGRDFMNRSIALLHAMKNDEQFALGIERPILIVDPLPTGANPILLNYWPGVFNQRFASYQFEAALRMGIVGTPWSTLDDYVKSFVNVYIPYEVDILTSKDFARELLKVNPEWAQSIYLYEGDEVSATITRYTGTELVG